MNYAGMTVTLLYRDYTWNPVRKKSGQVFTHIAPAKAIWARIFEETLLTVLHTRFSAVIVPRSGARNKRKVAALYDRIGHYRQGHSAC